jgi:hypothetical protein
MMPTTVEERREVDLAEQTAMTMLDPEKVAAVVRPSLFFSRY